MDEDARSKAKVVRGTVALVTKELLGSFIGIFYLAVVVRELGVEGMAVVSMLSMVYTLFPLLFLIAIPTAIEKFIAEHLGRRDEEAVKRLMKSSYIVMLVTSVASLATSFAIAPFMVNTFFEGKYLGAFQLVSFAIATYIGNSVLGAIFFGFQLYEKYGAITFAGRVAGRAVSIILILLQYGLPAYVASWVVENLLVIVLLAATMPRVKAVASQAYPMRPLVAYSFPLFASTFVSYLGSGVFIRLLILNKLSSADLGIYETSMRVIGVLRLFQSTFLATFFPHLSKVYGEKGTEEIGHNIAWSVRLFSFVFSPIIVGLSILARPFFYILFGREFEGTTLFVALLVFSFINFILSPFTQGMQALGYTRKMLYVQLASTAIAVVGSWILVGFGILGVTVGAESLGLASSVLNFYLFKRYVKPEIGWKRAMSFLLASLAMALPVYLSALVLPKYRYLPLQIAVGVGAYVGVVRAFKLVEKEDLDVLASLFPARLRGVVLKIFGW